MGTGGLGHQHVFWGDPIQPLNTCKTKSVYNHRKEFPEPQSLQIINAFIELLTFSLSMAYVFSIGDH